MLLDSSATARTRNDEHVTDTDRGGCGEHDLFGHTGIGAVLLHVVRPERPARGGRRTGDRPRAAGGAAGRIARRTGVYFFAGNDHRGHPVRVRTTDADAPK